METTWSDWQGLPDKAKLWEYVRKVKINKDEDLQKVGDADEAKAASTLLRSVRALPDRHAL